MARITVEDCAEVVENRFELVVLASYRAKVITSGSEILVERDNDKNAVIALREIAERKVNTETLRQLVIQNMQKTIQRDFVEEESSDLANEIVSEMMEFDVIDENELNIESADEDDLDTDADSLDTEE